MKGSEIIARLKTDEVHDFIEHDMIKIEPDYDYIIVKGTESHPRVIGKDHEQALKLGRYLRLKIVDREVVSDIPWTTAHNPFEGDVEPKFARPRPKKYMIK
jgi:hypothetical protein